MGEGFTFHLLGVAALTLIAGPALALVGSAIVVTILMLVKGGVWASAALAWCTMAALPVAVTWATLRFAERRLPPNFFVYVFVVAFFGAALSLRRRGPRRRGGAHAGRRPAGGAGVRRLRALRSSTSRSARRRSSAWR